MVFVDSRKSIMILSFETEKKLKLVYILIWGQLHWYSDQKSIYTGWFRKKFPTRSRLAVCRRDFAYHRYLASTDSERQKYQFRPYCHAILSILLEYVVHTARLIWIALLQSFLLPSLGHGNIIPACPKALKCVFIG